MESCAQKLYLTSNFNLALWTSEVRRTLRGVLPPLTSMFFVFCRKRRLTDSRACWGHSWNQLMAVQFTMAGNFLLRILSLFPTGEKQRVTWDIRKGAGDQEGIREIHREADMSSDCWSPRKLKSMLNSDRIFPCEPILLAKRSITPGLLCAGEGPVCRGKWYPRRDAQSNKCIASPPPPPETVQRNSFQLITSCSPLCLCPCPAVFLYLKLSPDSVYEELPAVLSAVQETLAFDLVPHVAYDVLDLIIRVEIWDLTWGRVGHKWVA